MGRPTAYSQEELDWIQARSNWTRAQLHDAFCAEFDRSDVSYINLRHLCQRRGWFTGRHGGGGGRFKAGQDHKLWRGLGHEKLDRDGYVTIIVDVPNPLNGSCVSRVLKHRYLWEKEFGPVPEGCRLKCRDGNKLNTGTENWFVVPLALLGSLNKRKYNSAPDQLKPTIIAISKLEVAFRERARKE